MKKFILLIVALLAFMPQASAATNDYRLHSGDVLAINVFGYPELSFPAPGNSEGVVIRPDGKIAYPFLGEVIAAGLSSQELAQLLNERLVGLYKEPNITINVMRFGTERVYVLGEVNQPGTYELDKSRNLLDAIGAAKGWTKDAAKTKVFLIHKDQKIPAERINLMAMLKNGDVSKNVPLREGDVIYLTGNNRIDFSRDILPFLSVATDVKYLTQGSR